MRNKYIDLAINKLGIAFDSLDLTFHQMDTGIPGDVTSYWPGDKDEDTLRILKSMLQTLLLEIARRYKIEKSGNEKNSLADRIIDYMGDHSDVVRM